MKHSRRGRIFGSLNNQRKRLAQSVFEYALLLAIVSAAFTVMAVYVRRAVQGRVNVIDQQLVGKANRTIPTPPPDVVF